MHIVFFTMSLNRGGTERVIANLCNEYLIKKHQITIITCLSDQSLYDLDERIQHIRIDKCEEDRNQNKLQRFIRRRKSFKEIVMKARPDIVINFLPEPSFIALSLKKRVQVPFIVSERSDPFLKYRSALYKFLILLLYSKSNGFVFQTEGAKSFFNSKIQEKSVVIPNPITSDVIRTRFEGVKKKEIVAVGRLVPEKNYKMLFYAIKDITNEFPEYVLKIYGDGPLREELEQLKNELGMENHIFLMGRKDNVFDLISESTMFVLSSAHEGMPNALMEAMALGLPVVSTDCPSGGPQFLIEHDSNGILVKNNDAKEMAQGIRKILSDEAFAEKIGKNASKIAEKLAPEKISRQWEEYIHMIQGEGV